MTDKLLPFIYATLVFSVVSFFFILLWRIFMDIDTIYFYEFDCILKKDDYFSNIDRIINERGENGWRYIGKEEYLVEGTISPMVLLMFQKSKNKIKIFK